MPAKLKLFVLLCLLVAACSLSVNGQNRGYRASKPTPRIVDILIQDGRVYDGAGAGGVTQDVGITADRIVFIGNARRKHVKGRRVIDASGLVVSPGFIDPHTHTLEDLSTLQRSSNLNYLMQGVTTVVTGNDGSSPLNIEETLKRWDAQGIGTNAALLIGQGSVRLKVLGMSDARPTPEQLEQMKALVSTAMDQGAFGMSTGLYYAPGSYSSTEEVIELAKVAAAKCGIYDTHMRDESTYSIGFLGSVKETLRIGREANIPVHISHIKALGPDTWGQSTEAISLIKQARDHGLQVTANQYPYTASGTGIIAALVPTWAEVGGMKQLLQRLDDSDVRPRLLSEMEVNMRRRGGPESLLITSFRDRQLVGKTLGQAARDNNRSVMDEAIDLIKAGGAGIASFNMNENDIANFMKQSFVMTGSDGSAGHPRKYGTFPRKLREYVFEKRVISLPFAIRSSSSLTAETFRITERGKLKIGYFADVIVFDPKEIRDLATYEEPEKLATGMRFVLVNGKIAVDEGKFTGVLAGRALRRTQMQRLEVSKNAKRVPGSAGIPACNERFSAEASSGGAIQRDAINSMQPLTRDHFAPIGAHCRLGSRHVAARSNEAGVKHGIDQGTYAYCTDRNTKL
jgi:N-acyl-D-amino-acid deacylase